MNKKLLLKRIAQNKNHKEKGLSLTELIVALVMSGIILTAASSGFANLLSANQEVESKSNRSAGLQKALAFMQNEIREGAFITQEAATAGGVCNTTGITSVNCLVVNYRANQVIDGNTCTEATPKIYYGYEDIKNDNSSVWLKPGILKRKVVCTSATGGNWQVIADGLISLNEANPVDAFTNEVDFCSQGGVSNWTTGNLFGANAGGKGGFRFCLGDNTNNNRLVRIFLFGHIIGGNANNIISTNIITFARAR